MRPSANKAVALAAVGAVAAFAASTAPPGQRTVDVAAAGEDEPALIAVAPPPLSPENFPCSQCHGETDEVDTTRRELAYHTEINFEHDSRNRWCLDCHDAQHRDSLRLADGRLLSFDKSYLLCGQCHGTHYRDWRHGEHGKRTGSWSGEKQYLLCASCHDPHSPRIKPIEPLPPPIRQENIR